ncbi:MAG: serine/threonine protein kinase, partial [Planctomycetes bacterium]|nr:serine/threonine protein kinase [Planctomycetota bacterium]
ADAKIAASVLLQLSSAVAVAHSQKILHRDIKPSNILLAPRPDLPAQLGLNDFVPKLADFGTAKFLQQVDATQTQGIVGTPAYMAPEQIAGRRTEIGEATDIYALGAVLYEVLTGQRVIRTDDNPSSKSEVVSPRVVVRSIPRDLEAICLMCLRNNPAERYGSALALESDLRNFLSNHPIVARRLTIGERAYRWSKMNPVITILSGIVVLSGLVVLGLTLKANRDLRDFNRQIQAEKQRADESFRKAESQQQQAVNAYTALVIDVIDKLDSTNGSKGVRDEVFGIIDKGLPKIIDPEKLTDHRSIVVFAEYLIRLVESSTIVDPGEARRTIDRALLIASDGLKRFPDAPDLLGTWANILKHSATVSRAQGNITKTFSDSKLCIEVCERLSQIDPQNQRSRLLMPQSYSQLAFACVQLERYRDALANYQMVVTLLKDIRAADSSDASSITKLAQAHRFVGDVALRNL